MHWSLRISADTNAVLQSLVFIFKTSQRATKSDPNLSKRALPGIHSSLGKVGRRVAVFVKLHVESVVTKPEVVVRG